MGEMRSLTFCGAPALFWPRQAPSLPVCSYVADYVLRWGQLHVGRERGFGCEIRLEETIAEGGRLLGHVLNFLEVMPIGHRAANKVGEPEVQLGKSTPRTLGVSGRLGCDRLAV